MSTSLWSPQGSFNIANWAVTWEQHECARIQFQNEPLLTERQRHMMTHFRNAMAQSPNNLEQTKELLMFTLMAEAESYQPVIPKNPDGIYVAPGHALYQVQVNLDRLAGFIYSAALHSPYVHPHLATFAATLLATTQDDPQTLASAPDLNDRYPYRMSILTLMREFRGFLSEERLHPFIIASRADPFVSGAGLHPSGAGPYASMANQGARTVMDLTREKCLTPQHIYQLNAFLAHLYREMHAKGSHPIGLQLLQTALNVIELGLEDPSDVPSEFTWSAVRWIDVAGAQILSGMANPPRWHKWRGILTRLIDEKLLKDEKDLEEMTLRVLSAMSTSSEPMAPSQASSERDSQAGAIPRQISVGGSQAGAMPGQMLVGSNQAGAMPGQMPASNSVDPNLEHYVAWDEEAREYILWDGQSR